MIDKDNHSSGDIPGPSAENRPILILVGDDTVLADDKPPRRLLGLTLQRRAQQAAQRTGFARVIFASRQSEATGAVATLLADAVERTNGRLVIAPANALATAEWLEAATRFTLPPNGWACSHQRLIVIDGRSARIADTLPPNADLGEIERHLAKQLGAGGQLPESATPMIVSKQSDIPVARSRLLQTLVKDTDGFMAKHVERPISIAITRWLAETPITPNQMTLVSVAFGLSGAPFFLSASPIWQTVGALLFLWHSILDGCDGELARLKFMESRWGGLLDYWGDNVVHVAIFACIAVGWAMVVDAGWPLILGVAAVGGTICSASWVYVRVMRGSDDEGPLYTSVSKEPSEGLSKLLDGASRRDFIYLVILAAAFGKATWFLVMAAIGAPVFFLMLLVAAARDSGSR
jgi:phosphatidylglycerophosphate synthase